ncbi:post-transcriptional regulator [Marinicrinis lubricantis]|uniref:Post-transcriptional regulator n=1 Tax=Marinicrinis lubricantis TaxID=2086470 RepID=A0ABW1ITZ1_9BACL
MPDHEQKHQEPHQESHQEENQQVLRLVVGSTKEEIPLGEEERSGVSDEELSRWIEQLCISKAEEFRMLGYEHVEPQEIWECISDKHQKNGMPALHRLVNDILSLKVTQFMNWMTMSIYKSSFK